MSLPTSAPPTGPMCQPWEILQVDWHLRHRQTVTVASPRPVLYQQGDGATRGDAAEIPFAAGPPLDSRVDSARRSLTEPARCPPNSENISEPQMGPI